MLNHAVIYELAKNGKKEELLQKEYQKICLGEFFGVSNALMLLGKHGCSKAVELLINSFKGNLNDAMQGYGWAGNVEAVNKMKDRGGSLAHALRGFALGEHHTIVDEILRDYPKLINEALLGYAQAGCVAKVMELSKYPGADVCFVIQGYAEGGHVELVNSLLNKSTASFAIMGYARAGNVEEVNHLLEKFVDNEYYYALDSYRNVRYIKCAIQGYARGGHVDQVNEILKKFHFIERAIAAYSYAGHLNEMNHLIEINKKHKADKDISLQSAAIEGLINGNLFFPDNQLRLLSYVNNELMQELFLRRKEIKSDLFYQARELNLVINQYKLNFQQAAAFKKLENGGRLWLLLGPEIFEKAGLPMDIFLAITYLLTDLTNQTDIHAIFHAINARNIEKNLEKNLISYQNGLPFSMFYQNISNIQQDYEKTKLVYNQKFALY